MILYPNLLKQNHLKNIQPFWINILERLSIGDCPFGTNISNGILKYKQTQINLIDTTPCKIIEFYKDIVGLNIEYIYFKTWKDIKRKTIKDNLIQDFTKRKQSEWDLSQEQTNKLHSMIHLYLTLKFIHSDHIHLIVDKQTFIDYIQGFDFTYSNFTFVSQ
jgi:hypothetical protein